MRPSSVLALVACVVLSISVTRGNKWNTENAEKGTRHEGEYSVAVGRTKKRSRQFGRSMWRASKVPRPSDVLRETVIDEDSTCVDRMPSLCNKFVNVYGDKFKKNCWRLPSHIRKRVFHKCQKTCGRCEKKEPTCEDRVPRLCNRFMNVYGDKFKKNCWKLPSHIRKRVIHRCQKTCGRCERTENKENEFNVVRRSKVPFPQFSRISQYGRQGGRDTPKSGVYYIYTKRVSL